MRSHFLPKSPLFGRNWLVRQKLAGSADGSVRLKISNFWPNNFGRTFGRTVLPKKHRNNFRSYTSKNAWGVKSTAEQVPVWGGEECKHSSQERTKFWGGSLINSLATLKEKELTRTLKRSWLFQVYLTQARSSSIWDTPYTWKIRKQSNVQYYCPAAQLQKSFDICLTFSIYCISCMHHHDGFVRQI